MISNANIKLGLYRIALDMTLKITDLCILKKPNSAVYNSFVC